MRKIFRYIVIFASGALTWHILLLSLDTLLQRSGTIGGEVLVLPLLGAVFYLGWVARDELSKVVARKGENVNVN